MGVAVRGDLMAFRGAHAYQLRVFLREIPQPETCGFYIVVPEDLKDPLEVAAQAIFLFAPFLERDFPWNIKDVEQLFNID